MFNHLKSLSAKIVAAVFTLVALTFVADTILTQSISSRVYDRTEQLTGQMHAIVDQKDTQIKQLLGGLLASKEHAQALSHTLAKSELSAESQQKQAYLEGTRQGISLSVASLVSNAMMAGEAALAEERIEAMLEDKQIAAINLWRTDGTLAFRDNVTIEAVNSYVDADVFESRQPDPAVTIPAERRATFDKALATLSNKESFDARLEDEDGNERPVTYSYFILKNSEDCQSCHDASVPNRGVLEVAVDSSELIALFEKSNSLIKQLDAQAAEEKTALVKASQSEKDKVAQQTVRYTAELNESTQAIEDTRKEASMMSMGSKIFFFFLTILLLVLALRKLLTTPLRRLTSSMLRLAQNDLSVEASDAHRTDEIGTMSKAIGTFKENAIERQKLEREAQDHMRAQKERQQQIDTLLQEFRTRIQDSLHTVSNSAESMQQSAASLNHISSATSDRAHSVNKASSHSSENVQMMAAASTEMTSSIEEIGQQVIRTNDLVMTASDEAKETDRKVAGLASAAEKIGEVVSLIKDISEQTNMLALNATIEAARAGEAGRGFAVVAAEVKELASQTGKATEDITSRVQTIQESTGDSVEAIRSIAAKMGEISQYTTAISAAVQEQNASTNEISLNIQQAAEGTKEIVQNISEVASSTEETKSSADEVQAASATVAAVATDMRNIIDDFLKKVAAA
ncbi:HAMP domain-containing methyl-accepting chemotaxis protein [uncultured Cohaesibacter sp.]|uniref:methyl-accepting chemotaxis protein n=1 Tax=uncultured Cohaesibacter sp. TaxID=1002546 RepID=UPI002AA6037C|nr:HAMP domain-containing methyl-accepting chemotaxis protein [uncultured Cohaesibacter sp.]